MRSLITYINEALSLDKDITFAKDFVWFDLNNLRLCAQHGEKHKQRWRDAENNCDKYRKGKIITIPAGTKCKFVKKGKDINGEYDVSMYQVPGVESPLLELRDSDLVYIEGYESKKISTNDIELVDLGLPSGLKWADRNIGAKNPEDMGELFYLGDAVENYRKNLPTFPQLKELVTNCKGEYKKISGQDVLIITGPNGNSITVPVENSDGFIFHRYCSKDPKLAIIIEIDGNELAASWVKTTTGRSDFQEPARLVGRKSL